MTKAAALELAADSIRVNSVCPGEIAYAVLFLASDESSNMSGCELVVDGAYTAA